MQTIQQHQHQQQQQQQFYVHPSNLMQQVAYMTSNGMIFQQQVRMMDYHQAQEQQYAMQMQQQLTQQLWAHNNAAVISHASGSPTVLSPKKIQQHPGMTPTAAKVISSRPVPASPSQKVSTPTRQTVKSAVFAQSSPRSNLHQQDTKVSVSSPSGHPFTLVPQSPSTPSVGFVSTDDYASDSTASSSISTLCPMTCREEDLRVLTEVETRISMRRAKRRHESAHSLWFHLDDDESDAQVLFALCSDSGKQHVRPHKRFTSAWSRDTSQPIKRRIDNMMETFRRDDATPVTN